MCNQGILSNKHSSTCPSSYIGYTSSFFSFLFQYVGLLDFYTHYTYFPFRFAHNLWRPSICYPINIVWNTATEITGKKEKKQKRRKKNPSKRMSSIGRLKLIGL